VTVVVVAIVVAPMAVVVIATVVVVATVVVASSVAVVAAPVAIATLTDSLCRGRGAHSLRNHRCRASAGGDDCSHCCRNSCIRLGRSNAIMQCRHNVLGSLAEQLAPPTAIGVTVVVVVIVIAPMAVVVIATVVVVATVVAVVTMVVPSSVAVVAAAIAIATLTDGLSGGGGAHTLRGHRCRASLDA
jgi:hypothetical protein